MAGMDSKQLVSTRSSVLVAQLAQSMTLPLGEGRSVAFPSPEPEIVQVATTPVPEPELTVEVGDRPTGHLEETTVFGRRLLRYSPSRPAYRLRVVTSKQPFHL